jgi:hypothetical protein
MMKIRFTFMLVSFAASSLVSAAPGAMIKDEDLRASASNGAAVLGKALKGATVDVIGRQGGWTQVSHAGVTGWVRILSVKSSVESSGAGFGGILQMGTARRDPSRVVAVAGVRGLNEEELRGAHFNAGELAKLQQYGSSRADAEKFAANAGLRSQKVAYIKSAKKESESNSNNSSATNIWGDSGL